MPNESAIYNAFLEKQDEIFHQLSYQLYEKFTPYNKLPNEYQIYQSYIVSMLKDYDVLMTSEIDTNDDTYIAWTKEEVISLGEFLKYCISKNWIDVSKINLDSKYADSGEIFDALTEYIFEKLENNTIFN